MAGHETFVVASGAACVLLQAKVRSMTHWRGSPGRLRAPAYSGHAGAGLVVVVTHPITRPAPGPYQREQHTPILTMPSPAAIRDIYQGLTGCHTGRPGQCRAELVPLTHSGDEANFFRRTLSVIRKGAGLYEASSL